MKLKKIQRILGTVFLATIITGCSPQLTTETHIHEAGETLPEEVTEYAVFKNPEKASEAAIDLSNVVPDKVGTYEAMITLKNKEYPFTVEVVDTTAPDGTFQTSIVAIGIEGKVTPDMFGLECTDISSITYGFRNIEKVKNQEELKSQILESISKAEEIGSEEILFTDLAGVNWDGTKDTWDEKDVPEETLIPEFVPEESGLYKLELASRDEYGNTDFMNCYVISDLEAPVLQLEDKEITVTSDFEKYMNSLSEGIYAEDNLFGDITDAVQIINLEIDEESKNTSKMKIYYEVYDLVGNKAEGSRVISTKAQTKVIQQQSNESYSNGLDRGRAEQAYALANQQRAAAGLAELSWDESIYNIAATRAEEVVSNYSHTRSSTGRTTVEDYNLGENLNKLWGDTSAGAAVQSWMESAGHKQNLLTGYYTRTAVACYQSGKYCYYVQLFGF